MDRRSYLTTIIVIALVAVGVFVYIKMNEVPPVACTLDAKICPDGSAVGRVGPNCEFPECPNEIDDMDMSNGKEAIDCPSDSRNVDVCTADYAPVCGTVAIQCLKAPCEPINQTFSNACNACKNSLVKSYFIGECS